MSSHGRRGLARVLLGSQATRVLTLSSVPVMVCRQHKAGYTAALRERCCLGGGKGACCRRRASHCNRCRRDHPKAAPTRQLDRGFARAYEVIEYLQRRRRQHQHAAGRTQAMRPNICRSHVGQQKVSGGVSATAALRITLTSHVGGLSVEDRSIRLRGHPPSRCDLRVDGSGFVRMGDVAGGRV